MKISRLICGTLFLGLSIQSSSYAHENKVVVIPLGGDKVEASAPPFRIVSHRELNKDGNPTGVGPEASRGRLEYTPDPSPSVSSEWGTVCQDNLFTNNIISTEGQQFATLACQAMGYGGGDLLIPIQVEDGTLDTALDNVACLVGDTLFEQCSSNVPFTHNCDNTEDVGVSCFNIIIDL